MTTDGIRRECGARIPHLIAVFAILVSCAVPARAATLNVPSQFPTIQDAVDASSDGDTVLVAPGAYTGPGNVDVDLTYTTILLKSSGGAANTTIDCQGNATNSHQAFFFYLSNTVLQGFTIENAFSGSNNGGAVAIVSDAPAIDQCIFLNNHSSYFGGAIGISGGSPAITRCAFHGNVALRGAAISARIYNQVSMVTLVDCLFTNNTSGTLGGALDLYGDTSNPSTALDVSVTNCSAYGNALHVGDTAVLGEGNTFGVFTNCIFYGDLGWQFSPPALHSEFAGLNVFNSDIAKAGFDGVNGNIDVAPRFADAPGGDLRILSTSPCAYTGASSGAPTIDYNSAPWTGSVSMGALDPFASATHFTVASASAAAVGSPTQFTVTAVKANGQTDTGYTGKIRFTSTDFHAILPANANLTGGKGTFAATFVTLGNQTISAADALYADVAGTSGVIAVSHGPTAQFKLRIRPPVVSGASSAINIAALDAYGYPTPNYAGVILVSSSDPAAVLPTPFRLMNGQGSFNATFMTLGSQTVTARDSANSAITGTQALTVATFPAARMSVAIPAGAAAGRPVAVNVTALDSGGNVARAYTGTIHFTSTDPQALLPADATLVNGTGTFSATLKTTGRCTLTATDTITASIAGTSGTCVVSPGPVASLTATAQASAVAGAPFGVVVTAFDAYRNVATNYTRAVHFTSTDPLALLPADTTLTNGVKTVTVTCRTVGSQTVAAIDTANARLAAITGKIAVTAH